MNKFETKEFYLVVAGGSLLSLNTGYINSLALVGYFGVTISHYTGSITKSAVSILEGDAASCLTLLTPLFSFVLGAIVSAMIIGDSKFKMGHAYGSALILETVCISISALLLVLTLGNYLIAENILSFSCGLQNAMATTYSGAVLRTTHMTGIITDIGIVIGHVIRKKLYIALKWPISQNYTPEVWRLKVVGPLLFSFWIGGFLGWFFWRWMGKYSLFISPIFMTAISAYYVTSKSIAAAKKLYKELEEKMIEEERIGELFEKVKVALEKEVNLNAETTRNESDNVQIQWVKEVAGIQTFQGKQNEDDPYENIAKSYPSNESETELWRIKK